MKARFLVLLVVALSCLALARGPNDTFSFDGVSPPHAVDTAGNVIPDSSVTQPQNPIILSNDSQNATYGELNGNSAFDHTKHNRDVRHTLDGQNSTKCVHCHHTEQPMPVTAIPYLTKSERNEALKAELLEAPNAQPVNSCRHCHFQTEKDSPAMVKYPKGGIPPNAKGERFLTNRVAYHIRCISCHESASKRDSKLNAPTGCVICHRDKTVSPAPTVTPTSTSTPKVTPTSTPSPTATPTSTP